MGNVIIIISLILVAALMFLFYYKKLKENEEELDYISELSIEHLTDVVRSVFAGMQKANLKEQNLSKRELEQEQRKKLTTKRYLKTAAYGDKSAKLYIADSIKEILADKKLANVNPDNIDQVIPFNSVSSLSMREKTDILFYIYEKKYAENGFTKFVQDFEFNKPKDIETAEEESGVLLYEITSEDFNYAFKKVYKENSLSYEDKLNIVVRTIFANYKGFGPIDCLESFAIDEVDCGCGGIMEGAYELPESVLKTLSFSYKVISVVHQGINLKLSFMSFKDNKELIRVCRNIYKYQAPSTLSRRDGMVIGTMKDGSRIAVARPPIMNTWALFKRKFDSTPSVDPKDLYKDKNNFIVITMLKYIMKAYMSTMITGMMGAGKTTLLKSIIRYLPTQENIAVYEISPELNLTFTYPTRNIISFSETESNSSKKEFTFGKKCNRTISIIGESASAEMGCLFYESCTTASKAGYGTHHAKTAEDLVLALRDNLVSAGGISDVKVAEESIVNCLTFNVHMAVENGHRYIERITEIIPLKKTAFPYDETKEFTNEDTIEYYKRMTDNRTFEEKNIVEYHDGEYFMVNPISDITKLRMRSKLPAKQALEFVNDMEALESLIGGRND